MTNNVILKIGKYSFNVLEIDETNCKIIVTPVDDHAEIVAGEWVRLILKNEFPEYYRSRYPYLLPLSEDAHNLLQQYSSQSVGEIGMLYNGSNDILIRGILPIDFKRDDSNHIGITFAYKEINE